MAIIFHLKNIKLYARGLRLQILVTKGSKDQAEWNFKEKPVTPCPQKIFKKNLPDNVNIFSKGIHFPLNLHTSG